MLSAADISHLIAQCSKYNVTKFQAGDISFTFSGYREPVQQSQTADLLAQIENDTEWMQQTIAPPVLPPDEVA